jgi:hypothetical protein
MGYTGKTAEALLARLLPGRQPRRRGRLRFLQGKRRITHEASLPHFLIFCNPLSSAPFLSGGLTQKIRDLDLFAFSSRFAVETRQDRPSLH